MRRDDAPGLPPRRPSAGHHVPPMRLLPKARAVVSSERFAGWSIDELQTYEDDVVEAAADAAAHGDHDEAHRARLELEAVRVELARRGAP